MNIEIIISTDGDRIKIQTLGSDDLRINRFALISNGGYQFLIPKYPHLSFAVDLVQLKTRNDLLSY